MADVFLSHSSSDRDAAAALEHGLEEAGLSVWWDLELVSGQRFQEAIVTELNRALAVVVIWSPTSVKSAWVYSEARRAIDQGKLVQVRTRDLNAKDLPAPFDAFHCSDIDDKGAVVRAARALIPSGDGMPAADTDADEARPQRLVQGASARRQGWTRRRLALAGLCVAGAAIVTASILAATGGDPETADACLPAAEPHGSPEVTGIEALDDRYAIASPIERSINRFTLQLIDTVANGLEPGVFATDAARATLSWDRKSLLYLRQCGDSQALWIRGVDGSNHHPFFNPNEQPPACREVNRPAWNANGKRVAFTCEGPNDTPVPYVFIFGSDGSPVRTINVRPPLVDAVRTPSGGPTWVGDDALVYPTMDENEKETLWICTSVESVESGCAKHIRLTPEDKYSYSLPDWSHAEGGRLLLLRSEPDVDGEPMKTGQIVWMSLPKNDPQRADLEVWSLEKTLTAPTWSPDGEQLMFLEGSDDEGGLQTLYIASFSHSDRSDWQSPTIGTQSMAQPAWGPR